MCVHYVLYCCGDRKCLHVCAYAIVCCPYVHTLISPLFLSLSLSHVHTENFLQESAYIHALSVSVIAHTVAKACTQGFLPSCSCDDIPVTVPSDDDSSSVTYMGCSVSIEYGLEVAEAFLSKRYATTGRVLKLELVQHNIRAAKMVGCLCVCVCACALAHC